MGWIGGVGAGWTLGSSLKTGEMVADEHGQGVGNFKNDSNGVIAAGIDWVFWFSCGLVKLQVKEVKEKRGRQRRWEKVKLVAELEDWG